ncbi:MAG: C4-dicarboxylate transporter DcuC, partial [Candidatus Kapabacteria bacterium]|nr:C4-dicarboxylate transporter DcuC [Candidatus Kapabacteria bacterium]
RLLVRPLWAVRWALIPGGCAVGFLANMAMTSQTACAAAVGPILVPLMIAARFHPLIAGATLVIGCSVGGNLFNPGEPDIVAISGVTGWNAASIINRTVLPNILSFVVATGVLTVMGMRFQPSEVAPQDVDDVDLDTEPVSLVKALLPPLPVVLLLILQPGLNVVQALFDRYPDGLHVSTIMLICSLVVLVVTWKGALSTHVGTITTEFFSGMGYAFTHVISLIIAAGCFIDGLTAVGAIKAAAGVLTQAQAVADAVSPALTAGLAWVSGSGTAPSISFTQAMVPAMAATDAVRAVDMGILGAIGASLGRTMSPVAAIVLYSATLIGVGPSELTKVIRWPVLAALVAVIAAAVVF